MIARIKPSVGSCTTSHDGTAEGSDPYVTNDDKKSALTTLEAARLREFVDSFGVTTDKRRRETMIDALLEAGIEMGLFLGKMTRDELKAMCRALGLSDEGREKVVLVSRLLVGRPVVATATYEAGGGTEPARRVLELLRREELRDAAEREGVAADRRSIGTIADALVAANVPLFHVLEHLPRTRLKEVCRTVGLDDSGREKVPLVNRLLEFAGLPPLDAAHHEAQHEEGAPEDNHATNRTKLAALEGLLHGLLNVDAPENYWPAKGHLVAGEERLQVDLYARIISGTGRNEAERRFQNPPSDGAIHLVADRPALLLGLWLEQGADRCVLVAFDAYRRADRTTRFSLFMPLTLLEQAADTGFATHITGSGETLYAFRPENAARYMDIFTTAAPWLSAPARRKAHAASSLPPVSAVGEDSVEIRPRAGMFAAFARLNYKPWFALAELVDNAVQSHLANLAALRAHGVGGPLVVDIVFEDDEISLTDRACGIALKDFERAFSPATPPPDPTGLSEFGLGMKASASWFAREWSVRTSALGEPVERTVAFDIPKITREGLERLPVETRPARAEDHFTVVSMRKLRVRPRGTTLGKMKEHLASIYRGLIADGTLRLRVTSSGRLEELAYAFTPSSSGIGWTNIGGGVWRAFGTVGDTTSSPVTTTGNVSAFLPGTLNSAWVGTTWTPDKEITVTQVQAQAKTAPMGCSTSAVVSITDGSHPVTVGITAAANETAGASQSYAAGTALTIRVATAAAGCSTNPADVNVVVQYHMQQ